MAQKNKNLIYFILGLISFFELLSFAVYLLPVLQNFIFFILAGLIIGLSLIKLEYGFFIALAELLIGSKGYLFYYADGGLIISLRIALWIIILGIWLARAISCPKENFLFLKSKLFFYYLAFFGFLFLGILSGIFYRNDFDNLFFDLNNWLYLALVFPLYDLALKKQGDFWQQLKKIFFACLAWLGLKTLALLFFFSHFSTDFSTQVYRWIRSSGVGEITMMEGGFMRIFFQSHIYSLVAIFIFLALILNLLVKDNLRQVIKNKVFLAYFTFLTLNISVIIISLSRSFWVGLVAGLIIFGGIIIFRQGFKVLSKIILVFFVSGIISLNLIFLAIKFPYPQITQNLNAADALKNRASQIEGEAAVSSRWALLDELWAGIKINPFWGSGFGKTIAYKSSDPRVLETSATGEYATYAFEWGWLGIWLKIGIFGLISCLALIFKILFQSLNLIKKNNAYALGLALGLIVIAAVHVFTPYLNHPLGLAYLILIGAFYEHLS